MWREIEIAVARASVHLDIIPKDTLSDIEQIPEVNDDILQEIQDREAITKHDIAAFVDTMQQHSGPGAKYLHYGITSSDILDTALALQIKRSIELVERDLRDLLKTLWFKALEHKYTICMGRTHGICAEPITFGIKLLRFCNEFERGLKRINTAKEEISTCKITGPVGTYTSIDPRVESMVAKELGLEPEPMASQVIPRDKHAAVFAATAILAGSIENFAIEIRHLQRTEVSEAREGFAKGQKGSSAMPHKRNPILSENITGLARIMRGHVIPALENIALWHERDISHSSVERINTPDTFILLDFALNRTHDIIENLYVDKEQMLATVKGNKDKIISQPLLLYLVKNIGLSRDNAYAVSQCFTQNRKAEAWRLLARLVDAKVVEQVEGFVREFVPRCGHVEYIYEKHLRNS